MHLNKWLGVALSLSLLSGVVSRRRRVKPTSTKRPSTPTRPMPARISPIKANMFPTVRSSSEFR